MMMTAALFMLASSSPAIPLAPQRWLSATDYPADAREAGAEGVTGFEILIGMDGKPKACHITQSAGHASLDAATCKIVMRRARWKPARNEAGEAVESLFSSRFTWSLPR